MKKYFLALLTIFASISLLANIDAIACKGKILPETRVSRLAAASPAGSLAIIKTLDVKKGDFVKEGQTIATLVGINKAKASLERASFNFERAKKAANLNILRQKQNVLDLEGNYAQNQKVLTEKEPPRREKEQIEFEQETLLRHIAFSKEMLVAIEESENASVKDAELAVKEAQLVYEEYTIKAPISGVVVEIHCKVGEAVGNDGLCELADTAVMYVEAEVYESDVKAIKVGDKAECKSDALEGVVLKGKLAEISQYVRSNKIFSNNPSDFTNSKVVLVKILLDNAKEVQNLIGSQVSVRILLSK